MVGENIPNPEHNEAATLRADIDKLFTPDFCQVTVHVDRLFLTKFINKGFYLRNIPKSAYDIAAEDTIMDGYPYLMIDRTQQIKSRFGMTQITFDQLYVGLTTDSGGIPRPLSQSHKYTYSADLLAQEIPLDGKIDRIIKACLGQTGNQE